MQAEGKGRGTLAGPVSRAYDSWSRGRGFNPHAEGRDYVKKINKK